jgi:starvation-inducible outer membrane lipoprotein
MKKISLMITLALLLSGCATRSPSWTMPALDTQSQMQCARECEYVHGGSVRGCNQGRTGATRGAGFVEACIKEAYAGLRSCYLECG